MPIVPVINGGVTPSVRRPRLTIAEGVAISGPFPFALRSNVVGQYRPGPNDVTVLSDRVALVPVGAAAPAAGSASWGADTTWVDEDIGTTPNVVADLYIKSIDANADGYDDLESSASVTIANAFATLGDGMLSEGQYPVAGSGAVSISGSGAILPLNPVAGVGGMNVYGIGYIGVEGAIFGTGTIEVYATGAILPLNPVAGTGNLGLSAEGAVGVAAEATPLTGTYYPRTNNTLNTTRDSEVVSVSYMGPVEANLGSECFYRLVVLNSNGTVNRVVKDWTSFGAVNGYHVQLRTLTNQSFNNPNVAATEFFALQYRAKLTVNGGIADSGFFRLPQGLNPLAQAGMTVTAYSQSYYEEYGDATASIVYGTATYDTRIVFAGS